MLPGLNLGGSSSSLRKLTNISISTAASKNFIQCSRNNSYVENFGKVFLFVAKFDLTIPVVDFLPAPNRPAINHLDYAILVNVIAHFRLEGQVVKRLKVSC